MMGGSIYAQIMRPLKRMFQVSGRHDLYTSACQRLCGRIYVGTVSCCGGKIVARDQSGNRSGKEDSVIDHSRSCCLEVRYATWLSEHTDGRIGLT